MRSSGKHIVVIAFVLICSLPSAWARTVLVNEAHAWELVVATNRVFTRLPPDTQKQISRWGPFRTLENIRNAGIVGSGCIAELSKPRYFMSPPARAALITKSLPLIGLNMGATLFQGDRIRLATVDRTNEVKLKAVSLAPYQYRIARAIERFLDSFVKLAGNGGYISGEGIWRTTSIGAPAFPELVASSEELATWFLPSGLHGPRESGIYDPTIAHDIWQVFLAELRESGTFFGLTVANPSNLIMQVHYL